MEELKKERVCEYCRRAFEVTEGYEKGVFDGTVTTTQNICEECLDEFLSLKEATDMD